MSTQPTLNGGHTQLTLVPKDNKEGSGARARRKNSGTAPPPPAPASTPAPSPATTPSPAPAPTGETATPPPPAPAPTTETPASTTPPPPAAPTAAPAAAKPSAPPGSVPVGGDNKVPAVRNLLRKILQTRRKHNSKGDLEFRLWLFNYIKKTLMYENVVIKDEGNIFVTVDPKSSILFSCHVDTVHGLKESDSLETQALAFDETFNHLFLADRNSSGCLGADDGIGIYIMLRMLEKKVPGHYIFHTGEECGGVGSSAFVRKESKWLFETIEAVVAFDRKVEQGGNPEIIHTQGGRRCASDEFSTALGKALSGAADFEKPYVNSDKGTFTDSKNYASIVAECVNVGCFYNRQHGPQEYVEVDNVERLVTAACKIDWHMLPIIRKPGEEPVQQRWGQGGYGGGYGKHGGYPYGGGHDLDGADDYFEGMGRGHLNGGNKPPASSGQVSNQQMPPRSLKDMAPVVPDIAILEDLENYDFDAFTSLVEDSPTQAVFALMMLHSELEGSRKTVRMLKDMMGI